MKGNLEHNLLNVVPLSNAGAGALRRRLGGLGGGNSGKDKLLRFYTDDAPGLKLPPVRKTETTQKHRLRSVELEYALTCASDALSCLLRDRRWPHALFFRVRSRLTLLVRALPIQTARRADHEPLLRRFRHCASRRGEDCLHRAREVKEARIIAVRATWDGGGSASVTLRYQDTFSGVHLSCIFSQGVANPAKTSTSWSPSATQATGIDSLRCQAEKTIASCPWASSSRVRRPARSSSRATPTGVAPWRRSEAQPARTMSTRQPSSSHCVVQPLLPLKARSGGDTPRRRPRSQLMTCLC